jgi:hypothetical protein
MSDWFARRRSKNIAYISNSREHTCKCWLLLVFRFGPSVIGCSATQPCPKHLPYLQGLARTVQGANFLRSWLVSDRKASAMMYNAKSLRKRCRRLPR